MALEHDFGKVSVSRNHRKTAKAVPREERAKKNMCSSTNRSKRQQECLYPRCLPAESRFCSTDPESSMTAKLQYPCPGVVPSSSAGAMPPGRERLSLEGQSELISWWLVPNHIHGASSSTPMSRYNRSALAVTINLDIPELFSEQFWISRA